MAAPTTPAPTITTSTGAAGAAVEPVTALVLPPGSGLPRTAPADGPPHPRSSAVRRLAQRLPDQPRRPGLWPPPARAVPVPPRRALLRPAPGTPRPGPAADRPGLVPKLWIVSGRRRRARSSAVRPSRLRLTGRAMRPRPQARRLPRGSDARDSRRGSVRETHRGPQVANAARPAPRERARTQRRRR